jgi:hypothetical protein
MQFNWREYLSLAKELLENKNEASYRSAISRAYYSIYNTLCFYIDRFKSQTDKHKQLIDIFKNEDEWHRINRNGRISKCRICIIINIMLMSAEVSADTKSH